MQGEVGRRLLRGTHSSWFAKDSPNFSTGSSAFQEPLSPPAIPGQQGQLVTLRLLHDPS